MKHHPLKLAIALCLTITSTGLAEDRPSLITSIYFEHDSSQFTKEASLILALTADRIKQEYPNQNIVLKGHTDSTGPQEYNLVLSQRRAQTVANALISRGISKSKLRIVGKGENAMPVSTSDGFSLALNRVVQVIRGEDDPWFISLSSSFHSQPMITSPFVTLLLEQ